MLGRPSDGLGQWSLLRGEGVIKIAGERGERWGHPGAEETKTNRVSSARDPPSPVTGALSPGDG